MTELIEILRASGMSGLDYILEQPDLEAAGLDSDLAGISHFIEWGAREGRVPPVQVNWEGLRQIVGCRSIAEGEKSRIIEALSVAHMQPWTGALRKWRFSQAGALAHIEALGGQPVLIFGDSHGVLYAARQPLRDGRWLLPIDLRCVGASARGLSNDDSISGNGRAIRRFINNTPHGILQRSKLLFKFGQVDIEFVIVHNAISKYGAKSLDRDFTDQFIEETASRYFQFLDELLPTPIRSRAYVVSAFPPALSDEHWASGYLKAHIGLTRGGGGYLAAEEAMKLGRDPDPEASRVVRAFEAPSLIERTSIHRRFNALLREKAARAGLHYMDDLEPFCGDDSLIDPQFVAISRGADHHIDPSPASFMRASDILWNSVGRF